MGLKEDEKMNILRSKELLIKNIPKEISYSKGDVSQKFIEKCWKMIRPSIESLLRLLRYNRTLLLGGWR